MTHKKIIKLLVFNILCIQAFGQSFILQGLTKDENENILPTTNKTLIRILTPLGQELQPEQANEGLFIYQYSDGSTRKVMKQ